VDEDEARRNGQTVDAFAAAEAGRWKKGLADWGQDGARIERLRQAAEFAIYTPGSRAGLPVSILTSFAAPAPAARTDSDAMAERAATTATSVLALAGVDAGPRSREHTLLSTLFSEAWSQGRDLDLPALIQQIQSPPFAKVGVVDLESFFPAKDRFDLAMRVNGLLAAPGFAQWLEGAPLDPKSLLYTAEGKPRVAIFSIAHLGDAERMFFVSLLLNQVVAWMRGQTGTSSLRAIVYMDEIAGYFPPVANPASKAPLLTLLKQARAFGLGVVLATQNPVDLDYKALGNTGTWFLGRLQTDRDKSRLLDGLESAAGAMDRETADHLLSSLDKRVFLLHDVHARAPIPFQTRWTMSYLRGPLSRDQISTLTVADRGAQSAARGSQLAARESVQAATPQPKAAVDQRENVPPVLPPGVQQFFVPRTASSEPRAAHSAPRTAHSDSVHYTPVVLGAARVGFGDAKLGIDEMRDVVYAAPFGSGAVAIDWTSAQKVDVPVNELASLPSAGATFGAVPSPGLQTKNYTAWAKDFTQWILRSEKLELLRQRDMKLTSTAGETEGEFKIRVQEAQRAARDAAVDDIKKKYEAKVTQLQAQRQRAEATVERESAQATQQKIQTGLSVGAAVLGALFGRKTVSVGSLGRATTAARGMGKTMKESDDIRRANENVETIRERERAVQEQIVDETAKITETFAKSPEIERLGLAPKRGQVSVQLVGLGWVPDR
jgi:hypothetical protein